MIFNDYITLSTLHKNYTNDIFFFYVSNICEIEEKEQLSVCIICHLQGQEYHLKIQSTGKDSEIFSHPYSN